jgi:hypothetical protein
MRTLRQKTLAVFGGYTNRQEAIVHLRQLPEPAVLISVQHPTGFPVTPLAYFAVTKSLLKEMKKELDRKQDDKDYEDA